MLKLDVSLTTFHTSVKRIKITFNSYNYTLFCYTSPMFFFKLYFLKITFPVNIGITHVSSCINGDSNPNDKYV